jgi:L-ascorbate metabolism protein UlaG (beta-lactamase superfamily)
MDMKVTYISHACLLIDTGKLLVATDPWFEGPAYCRQWNVFPRPIDPAAVEDASVLLISHAHEDHLHEPTLRRICKQQKVFYPYYWYIGTPNYIRSLGFPDLVEARSGRSYQIDESTAVTFLVTPDQNSIVVLEANGQVLINVNDALHASEAFLIDFYVERIKRRWPKIDVVFCGFGGASYYPNALHASDKDDYAIARLREQLFVHNFCRIIHGLAPAVAVPFAADFVLLAPHQRWINDVRFPREKISSYYAQYFADETPSPTIHVMYPGDQLVDRTLEATSPYRKEFGNGRHRLNHLIDIQYPEEISAFCLADAVALTPADELAARLVAHLDGQVKFYALRELEGLCFSLRFRDVSSHNWFNVRWTGSGFSVNRAFDPLPMAMVKIETTSNVLEASIDNDWGGDALMIGYGCDVTIVSQRSAPKAHLCVALLTRYPRAKSYTVCHPIRTMNYMYQSASVFVMRFSKKIRSKLSDDTAAENEIYNHYWLSGDTEAIRRNCRLPVYPNDSEA